MGREDQDKLLAQTCKLRVQLQRERAERAEQELLQQHGEQQRASLKEQLRAATRQANEHRACQMQVEHLTQQLQQRDEQLCAATRQANEHRACQVQIEHLTQQLQQRDEQQERLQSDVSV